MKVKVKAEALSLPTHLLEVVDVGVAAILTELAEDAVMVVDAVEAIAMVHLDLVIT